MKHLVIVQGALGDCVVTLPVLRAVASAGDAMVAAPGAKARLLARLAPGLEPADLESPVWARIAADPDRAPPEWRRTLAELELVVAFAGPDPPWRPAVERLAPNARCAWLELRPPADWPGHVMGWHRAQLAARVPELAPRPGPCPPVGDGPVLVHPGSGGPFKEWPLDRFRALAAALGEHGIPMEMVVGEAEIERGRAEAVRAWAEPWWGPDLDALADGLARARCFVGNDAGPSHLAAALGTPTVALFGPTSPRQWGPSGPRSRVLAPARPAAMEWLPVEPVLATVLWVTGQGARAYIGDGGEPRVPIDGDRR